MEDVRDWEIWSTDKVKVLEEFWKPRRDHDSVRSMLPKDYKSVLDVGCGVGVFYDLLIENGASYTGIDSSNAMIERAKERIGPGKFEKGDIYNIRFPEQSFDLVFCWAVLFHLPDIEIPIKELCRVSKKYVVFNVWSAKERNALRRGDWNEYIAEYTDDYLRGLLKKQPFNFEVIPITYILSDGKIEHFKDHKLFRKVFVLRRSTQH
jgi:ubiquinone/menaquinone biosynthesis C-methylase UbiE